jgi:hypothetical protein
MFPPYIFFNVFTVPQFAPLRQSAAGAAAAAAVRGEAAGILTKSHKVKKNRKM